MRHFRVGLTGGIASGKTTIANEFARLGARVIDTDEIAREVAGPGGPALAEIVAEFGAGILDADGTLDRPKLRSRVFADVASRRRLEAILHPRIEDATLAAAAQAGGPYQVLVVPLLIESGFDRHVDRVLVVDCPQELQRQRLLRRDRETPEQVERMLTAQIDRDSRLARADDVIDNSGTEEGASKQVEKLHRKYLDLARRTAP
jgi:dephospho-CoA kinase